MQSKEKRKINPRRRLLMRLIVTIFVIATLLVLGLRALKPKGAQIVYIAPDENGYDAIWLADLNDPENPRQLTFHEGITIGDFQVSSENSIVFYSIATGNYPIPYSFWTINLDTNVHEDISNCELNCDAFQLHPSGEWITYHDYTADNLIRVMIQNLETSEQRLLFESSTHFAHYHSPLPQWVGDSDKLAFRLTGSSSNMIAIYSIEKAQVIEILDIVIPLWTPHFSEDGSLFNHYPYFATVENNPLNIRSFHNPNTVLFEANANQAFSDWHPDNERVLITEVFSTNTNSYFELNLYNLTTNEGEVLLRGERRYNPTFSTDATQILYSASLPDSHFYELMLFDMETREEITLPIVGRDPQWVNGGR